MAQCARHTVLRQLRHVVFAAERQVGEHLALATGGVRLGARPSACGRSSTRLRCPPCAIGWSIVSRRTDACQYGSRAEFAIIDARHATPIERSSPVAAVRLLWHAMQSDDGANMPWSAAHRRTGPCAVTRVALRRQNSASSHDARRRQQPLTSSHRRGPLRTSPRGNT